MWKPRVWPGSSRTSHMRMNSFSRSILSPILRSLIPRSAATFNPNLSSIGLTLFHRHDRDSADLDQVIGRGHLVDFHHCRSRQRWLEILRPHFVDSLKVLHVADVDVDATNVVESSARGFNGGLHVLANLPGLFGDISDAGNAAIGPASRQARYEYKSAGRLDRGCVGENAIRLPEFRTRNL